MVLDMASLFAVPVTIEGSLKVPPAAGPVSGIQQIKLEFFDHGFLHAATAHRYRWR